MRVLGVSFIFLFQLAYTFASEDSLQLIHVLHRHGDRNPIHFCDNDIYSDMKFWPEGLGQLTKLGMDMEYKLGLWLRKRYGSFIDEIFVVDQVHFRSTDFDRTLMSGSAVASAFFYPTNVSIRFNETVPWMPVPIHSAESGNDQLINVDDACPRIPMEVEKVSKMPEILKFNEDHKYLFDIVSDGCQDDRHSIHGIGYLYDTLLVEKNHGLVLPEWASENFDAMAKVADYCFVTNTLSLELKRLRGGPLLGEFSSQMNKKAIGELPTQRMYMYSAHDNTVSIVLNSVGAFNGIAPPYASAVIVEMHKIDANYFVKMFYRNETSMDKDAAYPVAIEGCDHVCPLVTWTAIVSKLVPDNWSDECYNRNPTEDAFLINIMTGFLIMLVVIGLLLGWIIFSKSRKDARHYELLLSA